MAKPQVLEGTWEEIKQHDAELAGRRLRVIIEPEAEHTRKPKNGSAHAQIRDKDQPKQLRGLGMLAGVLSSEDFIRRKQEEIAREDRPRR